MQNRSIIIIISLLVVILIGWKLAVYFPKDLNPIQIPVVIDKSATSSPATTTPINIKPIDEKTDTINKAWTVFQKYLEAAKKHDLKTVTELSHQLSDTCKDPNQTKGCNALMDNVYAYGGEMQQKDYVNIWFDDKQIILLTKENFVATTTVRGIYKGFIYFTRGTSGNIKFLSFNPEVGAYVLTKDKSNEQVDAEIQAMIKDSDQDGLADYLETCRENALSTCVKTNPEKRDTDSDGWWDGTEALFYVKP